MILSDGSMARGRAQISGNSRRPLYSPVKTSTVIRQNSALHYLLLRLHSPACGTKKNLAVLFNPFSDAIHITDTNCSYLFEYRPWSSVKTNIVSKPDLSPSNHLNSASSLSLSTLTSEKIRSTVVSPSYRRRRPMGTPHGMKGRMLRGCRCNYNRHGEGPSKHAAQPSATRAQSV